MTTIINVTLYLSERERIIVNELGIDLLTVCREAIKSEIRDRAEIREICDKTRDMIHENARLREENTRIREQLLNGISPEDAIVSRLAMVKCEKKTAQTMMVVAS
jgi:regulator of replication initiation timing